MDKIRVHLDEFKLWNRKILNAYWLVLLLFIIGQLAFLTLDITTSGNQILERFLFRYMLIPDSIIVAILLISEFLIKYCKRCHDHLIILTSIAMSYAAFYNITFRLPSRMIVLIFPVFISLLYFNKKILITTASINLLAIWVIHLMVPNNIYSMTIYDLVVLTIASVSAVIVGIGIVGRGNYLLKSIMNLVKNEERLIVEKSIIDKLSKTDALTGLYNHRTFHDYIDTMLSQPNISSVQVQLAIMDIDNFKKVNDTYGHWSGDIVLKKVASIIQSSITPDDFAARYGGEEFAVIFIGKTQEETLEILETIRNKVSKKTFAELGEKPVTISIGVHSYSEVNDKEELFRCADSALYKAKSLGKNRIIQSENQCYLKV